MNVELIPLIELPTYKFQDLDNVNNNKEKRRLLIERNYSHVSTLTQFHEGFYKINEISDVDLVRAIKLHVSDLPIEESCSFFGGYALKMNEKIVLLPQCCGLLSEINDWKRLLSKNFEPFFLMECHPSPEFIRIEDKVHIVCNTDRYEPFQPKTDDLIIIKYDLLLIALNNLLLELEQLSKRLNKLGIESVSNNIANVLVWGKN